MNRVALKRLTRLTMDDYDLGHLDKGVFEDLARISHSGE
jgi:hypothetical protein